MGKRACFTSIAPQLPIRRQPFFGGTYRLPVIQESLEWIPAVNLLMQ
jgi:hypothetical protein